MSGTKCDCLERQREYRREYGAAKKQRKLAYQREYYAANRERLIEKQRGRYVLNKDRIAEYQRKYRAAHREQILEYSREYYAAHKEQITERAREFYAENRERQREYQRKWRAANREQINARQRERYAAQKAAEPAEGHSIRAARAIELPMYGSSRKCWLCGREIKPEVSSFHFFDFDHRKVMLKIFHTHRGCAFKAGLVDPRVRKKQIISQHLFMKFWWRRCEMADAKGEEIAHEFGMMNEPWPEHEKLSEIERSEWAELRRKVISK
ncbi:MAG: hypothetical protein IJ520_11365 [Synergistaceae bacterium]|nr:hypothetical protein [Synergistaceae bacterium]